jgi:hypothetical protein
MAGNNMKERAAHETWGEASLRVAMAADLRLGDLQCAGQVAETPEEFFWAVQASIRLKEVYDAKPL